MVVVMGGDDGTVRVWDLKHAAGKATVLGLATGSTPVGLYRELIRLHKDEGLDFSRVVTFNLDEYYPMPKEDPHSYFRWMHETFFSHINIQWNNIHIPDGTVVQDEVDAFCAEYEKKIRASGGIDVQILGIGRTGHSLDCRSKHNQGPPEQSEFCEPSVQPRAEPLHAFKIVPVRLHDNRGGKAYWVEPRFPEEPSQFEVG